MNSKITIKSLLLAICLLLSFNLQAQEVSPVTINVTTAGTLPILIASTNKYLITNLTVTGDLNGTDILYIREMAGKDANGNITDGKLSVLDLSGANIVAGGDAYYYSYASYSNCIGDYAFFGCYRLTSVIIPSSVTSIGDCAFWGCTGLTSVTIPSSVTSIGICAFSACTGLSSVIIPSSVTSIGGCIFDGCTELTSVTIPNSVTSIGDYAFNRCYGLASVIIPSSVSSIGMSAFKSCTGLTEIHCKSLISPFATSYSFEGINKTTCKLYVPEGTYANYLVAKGWGDFTNIIEEESTSTSISKTEISNIKVYSEQNEIIVNGADLGDNISVYTESGALLHSTKATGDIVRINIPTNQIYLVKTTGKTFKVAL